MLILTSATRNLTHNHTETMLNIGMRDKTIRTLTLYKLALATPLLATKPKVVSGIRSILTAQQKAVREKPSSAGSTRHLLVLKSKSRSSTTTLSTRSAKPLSLITAMVQVNPASAQVQPQRLNAHLFLTSHLRLLTALLRPITSLSLTTGSSSLLITNS